MNLSRLFLLTVGLAGSTVFAAAPSLTFESNPDQKSYTFKTENLSGDKVHCPLIEISAAIGKKDCSDILATYEYKIKNKIYKPGDKVENTTFGIDFLAQRSREFKDRNLVYCGPVDVKLDCK